MGKRVGVEAFVARLAAWSGGQIWFTERLRAGTERGFAQQTFKLSARHPVQRSPHRIHVHGQWGHDLSLLAPAIRRVEVSDRALRVTERLGPGVERVSLFQLLALRDEAKTGIRDVGHVWFTPSTNVAVVGGVPLACVADNFVHGASSSKERMHLRLRRASSDEVVTRRRVFLKALREHRGPIVFWVGASLREQLGFWWACHAIAASNLKLDAWLAGPENELVAEDPLVGLSVLPPEDAARLFCAAHPLSKNSLDAFAARWTNFCAGQPPAMRLANWPRPLRWMLGIPDGFAAMLPKRKAGAFRLAEIDTQLLAGFSLRSWRTPLSLIRAEEPGWERAIRLLGDSLLLERLGALAASGLLAVRATLTPKSKSAFLAREYNLTAHGRNALERGLGLSTELPRFPFGGF